MWKIKFRTVTMSNFLLDFVDNLIPGDEAFYADAPDASGVRCSLGDFEVYRQETDHTCGPAALRMTLQYMGLDIPEKKIAQKCFTHPFGTLHWTLLAGYKKLARKICCDVEMSENDPDVFQKSVDSIKGGRPVVFIYAVMNDFPPHEKCLHYGILTGIDGEAGSVMIANPFGVHEPMNVEEWWGRFSLSDEYAPDGVSLLMKLGLLKPRTALFLNPA